VKNYRVAQRYAEALMGLVEKSADLEEFQKELAGTRQLIERHPEISCLLVNTTIAREEKEDFLEKVLPEETSSLLLNFIKVLIKKRRFRELGLIVETFKRLYEVRKGLQRVRVESPVPLDEIVRERLRRALEKKLNRKVTLETLVKPELVGGLVLDFEGNQIDGSFKTALQELKQKLSS